MKTSLRYFHKRAFTLLEILLVVAIIAILAGIVIVAINPAKQLGNTRDAQRKSDINNLYKAVNQYLIDEGSFPTGITTSAQQICDTNGEPAGECLDLSSYLVPNYIQSIPKDPQVDTGSGYYITQSGDNVYLEAPDTEIGFTNQPGYSTTTAVAAFIGILPDDHTPAVAGSGIVTGGEGEGCDSSCVLALKNGLVGYWPVDGDANDTQGSLDGSWYGTANYVTGILGQAANFDGTKYIKRTNTGVDFGSDFTVSVWVKPNELNAYYYALWSADPYDAVNTLLLTHGGGGSYTTDNYLYWVSAYCGDQWVDTGYRFPAADVWYNVVTKRSGSRYYFYVNGEATPNSASATGCTTPNSSEFRVGNEESGYSPRWYNGAIDEIGLWDRALSTDEINDLYNSGSGVSLE